MRCVPLEPAAEKVCDASSIPPLIFELPPEQGRLVLEKAQSTPVYKYPAKTTKILMNLGNLGTINVYLSNKYCRNPKRYLLYPWSWLGFW